MTLTMMISMRSYPRVELCIVAKQRSRCSKDDDGRSQNTHSGDAEGAEKRTDQASASECLQL